jgi:exodeoxyribonuclease-3
MRITTWNVNGLRAALKKGFADRIDAIKPDVLLLQEVRARPDQLPPEWAAPDGWHVHWHPAEKPGYSGTAIWSREPMTIEDTGVGLDSTDDPEGRLVLARIANLRVASVYLPSGSSGDHRQVAKDQWLEQFELWAAKLKRGRLPLVLGGDFNIAHTARDLYYAKANEKQSGFLPHERAWMDRMLDSGWHDTVRAHAGDIDGPYSWWSNRGRARELDRGWRIDYMLANPAANTHVMRTMTHRDLSIGVSDHAPVSLDVDL